MPPTLLRTLFSGSGGWTYGTAVAAPSPPTRLRCHRKFIGGVTCQRPGSGHALSVEPCWGSLVAKYIVEAHGDGCGGKHCRPGLTLPRFDSRHDAPQA